MNEIFSRYSVRKYQARKVEREKIEQILRAAMAAPTARNQREWEFIVLDDSQLLEKASKTSPYTSAAAQAPLAIVVAANQDRMTCPANWEQDLGAACQNILLEAAALELGGCWMAVAPSKERMDYVCNMLRLPEKVLPFALIPIGYPAEFRQQPDRYEPDRVHWNGY
jgi:nitroreductase